MQVTRELLVGTEERERLAAGVLRRAADFSADRFADELSRMVSADLGQVAGDQGAPR